MTTYITYTSLSSKDISDILDLYSEYRVPTATPDMIAKWLDTNPAVGVWEGTTLIGFVYTQHYAPEVLEIDNIYIRADRRNGLVGTKLLEIIEKEANEKNYQAIFLNNALSYETKEDRKTPASFYLKNGYSIILKTKTTALYSKNI